jgi:hypothetical protein
LRWIIDNADLPLEAVAQYEAPHKLVVERVKPHRDANRDKWLKANWWRPQRMRPEMRAAIAPLRRFIVTPTTSKHRTFIWLEHPILPDHKLAILAFEDDYYFGVLHSHIHEVWALQLGTRLETRPNYTPTTCFETFPFPFADDLAEQPENLEAELNAAKHYAHIVLHEEPPAYQSTGSSRREEALTKKSETRNPKSEIEMSLVTSAATKEQHRAAIAAAAQELNELRERWLHPPEWTVEKILEFPGSIAGPWSRYIVPSTINPQLSTGLVRYPRLEPRDAECAAKLKDRTLTKLYNERPAWLIYAHKNLNAAVAAAYGWPADLTDEAILEKLLALNLARAAEEAKAAKVKNPKVRRAKAVDEMV